LNLIVINKMYILRLIITVFKLVIEIDVAYIGNSIDFLCCLLTHINDKVIFNFLDLLLY
jgi:hypothetical protein